MERFDTKTSRKEVTGKPLRISYDNIKMDLVEIDRIIVYA
jgi:hypothetical protein